MAKWDSLTGQIPTPPGRTSASDAQYLLLPDPLRNLASQLRSVVGGAIIVTFLTNDLAVPIELDLDLTAVLTADLDFVGGAIVADFSLRDRATRVFCQGSSNALVAGLTADRPVVVTRSLGNRGQGSSSTG